MDKPLIGGQAVIEGVMMQCVSRAEILQCKSSL